MLTSIAGLTKHFILYFLNVFNDHTKPLKSVILNILHNRHKTRPLPNLVVVCQIFDDILSYILILFTY